MISFLEMFNLNNTDFIFLLQQKLAVNLRAVASPSSRVQFVGAVTVLKSIQFQFFLISLKPISLFWNSPSILRGFQL